MIVIEYKLWLTEIATEAQAHEQVILNTASSLLEKRFSIWLLNLAEKICLYSAPNQVHKWGPPAMMTDFSAAHSGGCKCLNWLARMGSDLCAAAHISV